MGWLKKRFGCGKLYFEAKLKDKSIVKIKTGYEGNIKSLDPKIIKSFTDQLILDIWYECGQEVETINYIGYSTLKGKYV